MFIKQLSLFVENKPGRLAEITAIIAGAGIDIRALSIADTTNFGILRIIVDKPDEAERILREAGLTVSLTNVIAIGIPDVPRRLRPGDEGSLRRGDQRGVYVCVLSPGMRAGAACSASGGQHRRCKGASGRKCGDTQRGKNLFPIVRRADEEERREAEMTPSAVLLSPKRQDKSPVVPREEALANGGPPR